MPIVFFIFGLVTGCLLTSIALQKAKVGTLRVDMSDPDDGPYLFLELDKGLGDITSKRNVLLKVRAQNYLPRE